MVILDQLFSGFNWTWFEKTIITFEVMNVIKSKNNPHKWFKYLESMFKLVNIFLKCFENKYLFSLIKHVMRKKFHFKI